MRALAVIPARFGSSRFPGKPLALIGDKPMLQHVYERVSGSGLFEKTIIATDDARIVEAAKSFGAQVAMTSDRHETGTERCAEVLEQLDEKYDVVVNVQGDEPFIHPEPVALLLSLFEDKEVQIGTLVKKMADVAELTSANTAKVVLKANGEALYFSRSPIPYLRGADVSSWLQGHTYWKHIGIYAFRPEVLKQLVKLPMARLEKAESLEQLRWLENGYNIRTAETTYRMIAVDTPDDLEVARQYHLESLSLQGK